MAGLTWRVSRFDSVASTNDLALAGIRLGTLGAGDVLLAEEQSAGRGRRGRAWVADRGAILVTAVLPVPEERIGLAGLAAALGAAEGLRRLVPDVGVKWPNDLVLRSRKLGGVLVEIPAAAATPALAAVGVGINVNNPVGDVAGATSVREHLGAEADREAALDAVLSGLDSVWALLQADEIAPLLDRWRALDTTPGRQVSLPAGGMEGTAVGVDDDGRLRVVTLAGEERVASIDEVGFAEERSLTQGSA